MGQGQFGKVFAAIELNSGLLVALKELNTKQLSTSSFLRELTFLVTLDHFNIATCKALEHRQNKRYLAMDYCEGGTLRGLLNDSATISLHQSLQLIINVLRGLEYAHQQDIVHRDIKPENILLKISDRGYTAHIADFGIAKLSQQVETLEAFGDTGSPAYMAPEQFYGKYSFCSDLYGVGVILYELVTGERPFSGMPKELLAAHLSHPVPYNPDIPILVRAAIAKALDKLPQRRFQTANQMRESLELILEILESDPNPDTIATIPPQFVSLVPIVQSTFEGTISHLAIAHNRIYFASGDRLTIRHYSDASLDSEAIATEELTCEGQIVSLNCNSTGCLIAATTGLYFLAANEAYSSELIIAANSKEDLVTAIDSQRLWLASTSRSNLDRTNEAEFKLETYRLPQCRLQHSFSTDKRWQHLIAINNRQAIAIAPNTDRETEFHLVNRRGYYLANFTVQISLGRVVYNPLFGDRFIATENNNPKAIVLITLEGFNLQRIPLYINPWAIEPCPQGYLLSDRQGRIVLLDAEGKCVGRFQIPLKQYFMVTAIATSPSQLLIATSSSARAQSQLQTFSWDDVLLESSKL